MLRAILLTCVFAGSAAAEGAKTMFDCTAQGEPRLFTIAPVEIDADGAGAVDIFVNERRYLGTAAGHLGPFSWDASGTMTTLLLNGAKGADLSMLLHELDTAASPPTATQTLLTCEAPT